MRLSTEKRKKIQEQIISHLYQAFPKQPFTAEISTELARDEEFVKNLLFELKGKGITLQIKKNPNGIPFSRRIKWQLTTQARNAYNERLQ